MNISCDYYYGAEAEQFSFIRLPKVLFEKGPFEEMSYDAKILYAFMLDRMSLSRKNGWLDEENRVYIIYTREKMVEDMNFKKTKCSEIVSELVKFGLIEKKKRGLGKPDLIYVKNFVSALNNCDNREKSISSSAICDCLDSQIQNNSNLNANSSGPENELLEVRTNPRGSENELLEVHTTFRGSKNELLEVRETAPSKNNVSNTNSDGNKSIYPSIKLANENDEMDNSSESYIELIYNNLEYERYMADNSYFDKELYQELVDIVVDVVCLPRKSIRINGADCPHEVVKSRFLKLDSSHLEYVISCLKKTTSKVKDTRSYMITSLFNAPATFHTYLQQKVQYDMYGEGWTEKGIVEEGE